jgi:hypothetical protein
LRFFSSRFLDYEEIFEKLEFFFKIKE